MSVWAGEDGRTAETFAFRNTDGKWIAAIQWNDGVETIRIPMQSEAAAIGLADCQARSVLHPWYKQEDLLVSPLQCAVADNEG